MPRPALLLTAALFAATTATAVAQRPAPPAPVPPVPRAQPTRPPLPAMPDLPPTWVQPDWVPLAMPDWDHWRDWEVRSHDWELASLRAMESAQHALESAAAVWTPLSDGRRLRGLPEPDLFHQQGTPEDSLYRQARSVLNGGEYRRAADLFRTFAERHPNSRYAPASMYYQAVALYRVGAEQELRQALRVLEVQRQRHPTAAGDADVVALIMRLEGALAARGDAEAARRVREGAAQGLATCDKEDMEVRAEALSALVRADPASAEAVIGRTLARRDECSVPLRRRALVLLSQDGAERNLPALLEAARNDPDASVRSDALSRIARLSGDAPVRALEQIITTSTDERMLRSAIQALRSNTHTDVTRILRRAVEREDLAEAVRVEAVRSIARRSAATTFARPSGIVGGEVRVATTVSSRTSVDETDAAYLRSMYDRVTARTIRTAILETLASAGGSANDEWLMGIARNANEEMRLRTTALSRLRRADVPVEELGRLYDQLTERQLRSTIITYLGARTEDGATDKLIAIARTGTDPVLRRAAISALSRKKDERTTRLLLEIIER